MPGSLDANGGDVLRRALIALGLGTTPSANGSWPIYYASEPDVPDNLITVYDTSGRDSGRVAQGERAEFDGVQIRVRSSNIEIGTTKARAIEEALDGIYNYSVSFNSHTYRIQTIQRTGKFIPIGKEENTNRRLFTLNALLTLRQLS